MIIETKDTSMDTTEPLKQKSSLNSERNAENMRSNVYFGVILLMCMVATWLFARLYREAVITFDQNGTLTLMEYSWLVRLCLNLAGYATILVPGFILFKYLQRINYFDSFPSSSCMYRTLFAFFGEPLSLPESARPSKETGGRREAVEMMFCCSGLMLSYLLWGLLQEKLMTQDYSLPDGTVMKFTDSQFLVFINRLSAFLLAGGYLLFTRQTLVVAPLYKFSYCSLTNIVSAWCQYEALKYVSFPTQVLSKSCKVVPVMAMGRLVSRRRYERAEYAAAALLSAGMLLFMLTTHRPHTVSMIDTWSGLALLAVYMLCDSFTSTWQDRLFHQYEPHVYPTHMVCAVSAWSCVLTASAMWHAPELRAHAALALNPMFVLDCGLLCASSSLGQLLIYRTIARFGAQVFVIIMTCRQALSILLSCIVYGHHISLGGVVGISLVFVSVAGRIYWRQRKRRNNL